MAATRSPSAFPSPAIHPVLPSPRSALAASYVPHIDTVSSPSLLDSSTPTDENVSPIEDLLNACLANLASEGWRNDTEVWTWDTLEQQHRSPAALQMLFEDPELWGFIEALVRFLRMLSFSTLYPPHCLVVDPTRRCAWPSACFTTHFSRNLLDLTFLHDR